MTVPKKPICLITFIMKILLIITGSIFIQYKNLQLLVLSLAIFSYIPVFYATINIATDSSSNVIIVSESITMFLMFFSPFCITWITILHKGIFICIMERISNRSDVEFIRLMNKHFLQLLLILFCVAVVSETPYIICTAVRHLVYDVKLGTPESLIFPLYVPWHYDTIINYSLTMVLETFVMLHPFLMEYGMVLTLGSLYIYIDSEFANLLTLVQNIRDNEDALIILQDHLEISRGVNSIDADFYKIISSYQDWKSTSKEFIAYIADYSCVILLCVMICAVLSIANLTEADISIDVKIKNLSVLAYIFAHLYLVCFLGEYFQNADGEFRNAIYGMSWYTKVRKFRKTATMIMMQTQTPMTIKAYGMISVDKSLTLKILRNIYSVWNLYRNAYDNN